jgi:hypothetical protein
LIPRPLRLTGINRQAARQRVEIVKAALEVVEDGRRQIAYLNERDELDEMRRQREWHRRYDAAMGKEPEPIDDEFPW